MRGPICYPFELIRGSAVHQASKSWVAVIAIIAAFGVLFVLITPAADELPATSPHAMIKIFPPTSASIYLLLNPLPSDRPEVQFSTPFTANHLLAVLCTRLNRIFLVLPFRKPLLDVCPQV